MCKFVYIFRTDEIPFGSCQPCSNNIHITYDDNTAAIGLPVPKEVKTYTSQDNAQHSVRFNMRQHFYFP